MTANSIAYTKAENENRNKQAELRETNRANLAKEAENYRSNRAKEQLDKYKTDMSAASKQGVQVGKIKITGAGVTTRQIADELNANVKGFSSAAGVARDGLSGKEKQSWNKLDSYKSGNKDSVLWR